VNNIIKKGKYLFDNAPPSAFRIVQDLDFFRISDFKSSANIDNKIENTSEYS
jgi:hypothetical protein